MSDQPEALRLADALEVDKWHISGVTAQSAADELRRLHAEHIEDQGVIAVWRGRTLRAEQQRDELLEALMALLNNNEALTGENTARAAIAKAEEA